MRLVINDENILYKSFDPVTATYINTPILYRIIILKYKMYLMKSINKYDDLIEIFKSTIYNVVNGILNYDGIYYRI
jgi:hypothetical protein